MNIRRINTLSRNSSLITSKSLTGSTESSTWIISGSSKAPTKSIKLLAWATSLQLMSKLNNWKLTKEKSERQLLSFIYFLNGRQLLSFCNKRFKKTKLFNYNHQKPYQSLRVDFVSFTFHSNVNLFNK